MRFDDLAQYFERLENTSSRLRMYQLLGELFGEAEANETAKIAYLCEARLGPPFAAINIGMGERMVAEAIEAATGKSEQQINTFYKKVGDLGLVAQFLMPKRIRSELTVSEVHSALLDIAQTGGVGGVTKKVKQLVALIEAASSPAVIYIVRMAMGRLRLGVGAPTIIAAVARSQPDSRGARAVIERAYNLCSDLGLVLRAMREAGLGALKKFKVQVGNPVRMMLAERAPNAEAIVKRLGRCAAESKLDGFRCQIHIKSHRIEIFSRNLERTTEMLPDMVAAARSNVSVRNAIIEGEAIAINDATGEFYAFQVTVQRKRKHGVEEMAREFPLVFVAFDLLYANGKDYTDQSYQARRRALERFIKPDTRMRLVERVVTGDAGELQRFFDEQVERGMEGVVAKRLEAPYTAGGRNFNWIKLKRTYRGQLSDTIDVVVAGYMRGLGMRARLGIGAFLAVVYDADTDSFKTVGKVGSGLSEVNWVSLRKLLDQAAVAEKPTRLDSRFKPDVWVEPQYVVTVLADEITRSPANTCAIDESGSGLALRFPRAVGFVRADKSPEDATTVAEIKRMYAIQRDPKK